MFLLNTGLNIYIGEQHIDIQVNTVLLGKIAHAETVKTLIDHTTSAIYWIIGHYH